MSKFERLIIYPLLFIALFCALTRIDVASATQQILDKIMTKEIVVVNDEGKAVASLKYDGKRDNVSFDLYNGEGTRVVSLLSYEDGGAIGIFNSEGHITVALQNETDAGSIFVYNGTNKETKLVELRSGLYGGVLEVNNSRGLPTGILGNNALDNGYLGLFKGEFLGFLTPQIMLNVEEGGGTIETVKAPR